MCFMKKLCCLIFVMVIVAALPVCAMKIINPYEFGVPVKVKVLDVSHALQARVLFNDDHRNFANVRITMYVSNLDCHEFTKMRTYKSTQENISKNNDNNGNTYMRPSQYSVKRNSVPTKYIKSLFNQYPESIYVVVHGYGIKNNLVGEFYINNVSLNRHLTEKGYCTYVY